jgi:hypothetical protein
MHKLTPGNDTNQVAHNGVEQLQIDIRMSSKLDKFKLIYSVNDIREESNNYSVLQFGRRDL